MSEFVRWEDVKAKARAAHPDWDSEERVALRQQAQERMLASVTGFKLAELRKQVGMTQTQLARATGLSQARISQIEKGDVVGLETLRTYVTGLGGDVNIVVRIGDLQLDIA
jgi:DNA-binding XRE family transcriptional regulator